MNIGAYVSRSIMVFCQVVKLLGHMVTLFLGFKGTFILFSIVTISIYILINNARGFPFLHTLSSIYYS